MTETEQELRHRIHQLETDVSWLMTRFTNLGYDILQSTEYLYCTKCNMQMDPGTTCLDSECPHGRQSTP